MVKPDSNPEGSSSPPVNRFGDHNWITLTEFAKLVGKSYQTVINWARLNRIKAIRVGGTLRVYEEEIYRFFREGTLPPDPEKYERHLTRQRDYQTKRKQGKDHRSTMK